MFWQNAVLTLVITNKNKYSNDMKEQILEICNKLNRMQITVSEAQEQLLDLFAVSNSACTNKKELKPSVFGIVVDKSKATKIFPMRGTLFPKGSGLNP